MPTNSRKRDRWDSSSDDEDEGSRVTSKSDNHKKPMLKGDTEKETERDRSVGTGILATSTKADSSYSSTFKKYNPLLQGCRSVYSSYERVDRIDEGTYGVVWKAIDLATKEVVALKQVKFDYLLLRDGFPVAALREISILLSLSHQNIVTVREMVVGDKVNKVFMVMEVRAYTIYFYFCFDDNILKAYYFSRLYP